MEFNMNVKIVDKDKFDGLPRSNRTIYVIKQDKSVYIGKDPHRFRVVADGKVHVDGSAKMK